MPDSSLPPRDPDADPPASGGGGSFLAFLAAHRLLWLGPTVLGLLWLALLFALHSGGDGADYTYVLS